MPSQKRSESSFTAVEAELDSVTGFLRWSAGGVFRSGYRGPRDGAWPAGPSAPPARRASALEQRHLLARALDDRIEPEQRLEVGQIGLLRGEERAEVVPLQHVPVVAGNRLAQERRPLELVADELGALGRDDEEADERL